MLRESRNIACVAKLMILDGYSLAFRAFFALPETMITASGQYTNAIYGFTSMLLNLVKDHGPTHVVVAFDPAGPTFRHKISVEYKGTRKRAPESLFPQLSLIGQLLRSLGIHVVESSGFEADDVIATIAEAARERRWTTIVVTGDRDSFQLVSDPYVKVLYNIRGVSEYEMLDSMGIVRRTGVRPEQYPQFAALRGDPSDNIVGVPGVGAKTAAKLINDYGSVEGVLEHLNSLSPKLRSTLEDYSGQLLLNLQLTPLVRNVPLPVSLDELELGHWNPKVAEDLFRFLEFKKLWERTLAVFGGRTTAVGGTSISKPANDGPSETQVSWVKSVAEMEAVLSYKLGGDSSAYIEVFWSGSSGRSEPLCVAVSITGTSASHDVVGIPSDLLSPNDEGRDVWNLIASRLPPLDGIGLKEILRYVYSTYRVLFEIGIDGAVAGYLLDPTAPDYELESLAFEWLGTPIAAAKDGERYKGPGLVFGEPGYSEVLGARVEAGVKTVGRIEKALEARSLINLYEEIEKPLVTILAKMEALGILVDRSYLEQLQRDFASEARELQIEIQAMAGHTFNVNSTQQLGRVLFEKLGLSPQKRTKTGYSTDARSLERLTGAHPIIGKVMRYREVEKLRSTYGEGLLAEIGSDGRIHATFSQTVARTGRLSSDHPNLHNIPIRTKDGRKFRNAFIAPAGRKLVIADYSQIELRVIAHLSKDEGLVDAFTRGIDIHRQTASYTFGVPLMEATPAQRNKAKMVAYGLAYGMEAYGLSQRLGISVSEADEILKSFFTAFPRLTSYMKETVEKARRDGYTTTEFGRIRPLPELSSDNYRLREAAERQAMNAGIQGLAADIFKIALVKLDRELASLDADIVLQVHDEVIVECAISEVCTMEGLVKRVLETAVELSVPLEANVFSGGSWADAK